ncbi:PEP-CTERM sorting domain-containing protein [Candidatus Hydrogenedentota bacterium]
MKTGQLFAIGFTVMVFALCGLAHATYVQDFSSGLDGWEGEGNWSITGGVAELADDIPFFGRLSKDAIRLEPGASYTLDFDFLNGLSSVLNDRNLDTFFVTLYFVDGETPFDMTSMGTWDADHPDGHLSWQTHDPDLSYIGQQEVLDLNHSGPTNTYGGTVVPSALGGDWSHYSVEFDNLADCNYVIPVFEFLDTNYLYGDSSVQLDNITIAPVPEPASVVMFGMGMLGIAAARRKRRKGVRHEHVAIRR